MEMSMKEPSFQILSKLKTKEMKCALVELCKLDRAISIIILIIFYELYLFHCICSICSY